MTAVCRIQLLGALQVEQGGRRITRFQTHKTGALLAYLAFYRRYPHVRDVLLEILWPEDELDSARQKLRLALHSLRRQLEPPGVPAGAVIIANRATVQLSAAAVSTDVAEFEAALQAAARSGSGIEREHYLARSVELYYGELLPGYYEEWIGPERERLAEAYLHALRQLVRGFEQAGDFPRALQHARRAVAADPLCEEAHHDLMRLLAAAGHPEAALRHYLELERLLEEELGQVPEAGSRELAREIAQRSRLAPPAPEKRTPAAPSPSHSEASPLPVRLSTPPPQGPAGTVTFLLTEITGAAALREQTGEAFQAARETGRRQLRSAFREHHGHELRETADSLLVAFGRAGDALAAAVAGQWALAADLSPAPSPTREGEKGEESRSVVRVRMALHTGDVEFRGEQYLGPVLHHVTRLLLAAHPGQILVSEATASLLRDDLEPGLHLTDLGFYRLRAGALPERLFQVRYPDMGQAEFPPPNATPAHEGYLPLPFTRFFGRERELAELQSLLLARETRLVTLTGPGGSGKSRLALEVAQRLREPFRGAVWFVPLQDVSDPRLILTKVQDALRLPRAPYLDPLEQIAAVLSRQPSLLLLDNFEHLIGEAGGAEGALFGPDPGHPVQGLMERVPSLQCLVTSRQRLGLIGEREFPVAPLPIPGIQVFRCSGVQEEPGPTPEHLMQCASVQLFVDRAQAVRADFQLTLTNAAAVAALCARLEGLPLAVELAAARAGVLTPMQMLTRLEQRFDLLVSWQQPADPRHRSLRAALDWSYQLLPPDLQRFFARLSVFRGGWTLEAAAAICDEPQALEYLEQLRHCSLVQGEEGGSEMRFRLLETVREYATEQLSPEERAALARRHARHFLALAEQAEPQLRGPDQGLWFERLEAEHDNLRAALTWCQTAEGGAEEGLRLASALWHFWEVRGYVTEGSRWLVDLLSRADPVSPPVHARALSAAAVLAFVQGDFNRAMALGQESIRLSRALGEHQAVALGLGFLGDTALSQDDRQRAIPLLEESLALSRETQSKGGVAFALGGLGRLAWRQGETQQAAALLEESLALYRQLGDRRGIAIALAELGYVLVWQGEYERATPLFEEKLALSRQVNDKLRIAHALWHLGNVARCQGLYDRAAALLEESLEIRRKVGEKAGIADSLASLGNVAVAQGEPARARALQQESLDLRRQLGEESGVAWSLVGLGQAALAQGECIAARDLQEEGLAIFRKAQDRRGIARALYGLGKVNYHQGETAVARSLLAESLAIRWELGEKKDLPECLEGLAVVAGAHEQPERAARLFGAAQALREAIGAPLPPADEADHQTHLTAVRSALGEAAFASAWAMGREMRLEAAIAEALAETASL